MEFSEEKALEIIEKYELSPKTVKVWRTRGKIPKKYFEEGFEKRTPLKKSDLIVQGRLIKIFQSEKINVKTLCEVSEVSYRTVIDVLMGRQNLSKQQLTKLKTNLNKLRIDVKKVVEDCQRGFNVKRDEDLKQVLRCKEIKPIVILREMPESDVKKVYDWYYKNTAIPDYLKKDVVDRLSVFVLETSL